MDCNFFLNKGLSQLGIQLSNKAVNLLCQYFEELKKWNQKINLVAKASDQEVLETHFLDSLTLLPLIETEKSHDLLDIGTGAGFPGLVLKIVLPELEVTLVEPRQKRVSFLKHIIRTLGPKNIQILPVRLEKDIATETTGKQFPVITSRAFTSIIDFLELVEPLSPKDGKVICMKGPKAYEEIEVWKRKRPDSPFVLNTVQEGKLPFSESTRNLVTFIKSKN